MKLGEEFTASLALLMVIWVIFTVLSSVTDGVWPPPAPCLVKGPLQLLYRK